MDNQIFPTCSQNTPKTRVDCWAFDKTPKGLIITTDDFFIPADVEDKGEYLKEQALVFPLTQVFPLLEGLVNLEPTGGDVRIVQEGFQQQLANGNNPYQENYTFTKGGICLFKQLSQYDDTFVRVFFVDEDDIAFGTEDKNGDIRGLRVSFGTQYRRNIGTTVAGFIVTLLYGNNYKQEMRNATSFEIPYDIEGLRETSIKVNKVSTTSIDLTFITDCSAQDVTPLFAALETADITITGASGTNYTVSAITYTGDAIRLTISPALEQEATLTINLNNSNVNEILTDGGIGLNNTVVIPYLVSRQQRITLDGETRVTINNEEREAIV